MRSLRAAVLVGGLQGCCIALLLAARGIEVVLYERNDVLLGAAATANEGKIHLGYVYASDPTLATARTMIRGALAFAPFVREHLDASPERLRLSSPNAYAVHRESQRSVDDIAAYLSRVHRLVVEANEASSGDYFGFDLDRAVERWSGSQIAATFAPAAIQAVFQTPEIAIDPLALADIVRRRISDAAGRIEVRLRHVVTAVETNRLGLDVHASSPDGATREKYDHVINALWDGRIAIDKTLGLRPGRLTMNRFKYGLRIAARDCDVPSTTIVLGPFGDVITYGDRTIYMSWYPACMKARSAGDQPIPLPTIPSGPLRSDIAADTLAALSAIMPGLQTVRLEAVADYTVRGGVIVAWGQTDIDDPASELHRRFEIGVHSVGSYHSVDPGKLTMAPYFAGVCVARICAE
ncbi:MAG: FAD-dependent oxidoreductase [Xanthobacteraceae bacterium]